MHFLNRRLVVGLVVLAASLVRPAGTATMGQNPPPDWNVGDVFVGLGSWEGYLAFGWDTDLNTPGIQLAPGTSIPEPELSYYKLLGTYRVLSEAGTVKEDLRIPIDAVTTGCAVNPLTGEFWGTTFDGLTVETLSPTHDHPRIGSIDMAAEIRGNVGVATVESIVFDRVGNFYVGIPDEEIDIDTQNNTMAYDGFGSLVKFSPARTRLAVYRPPVNLYPAGYAPEAGAEPPRGIDWFDLSADGTTIFYTSEDRFVRTFKFDADPSRNGDQPGPGPGNALTIGGVTYPATPGVWGYLGPGDAKNYAMRLLPPGDGSGGAIVASFDGIHRLNAEGLLIHTFGYPGVEGYFAINLSPDARRLWTASNDIRYASVMAFDVMTGSPLFHARMPTAVNGLCVKLEYTSQMVDCTATPDSPLCKPLEACIGTSASDPGGDYDGDGLASFFDPDCYPAAAEVCGNGSDDDRDGLVDEVCDRSNAERDAVSFATGGSAPGETRVYSATGLPDGLTIHPTTGVISGTLAYTAANANAGTWPVSISVSRTTSAGVQITGSGAFVWHVSDVNAPPQFEVQDITVVEGTDLTAVPIVLPAPTDVDNDALAYSIWSEWWDPALHFNPATRTLTGIVPQVNGAESHQVYVNVQDLDASGAVLHAVGKWFTLTIVDYKPNRPPATALPARTDTELTPVTIGPLPAVDADGEAIVYTFASLPPGVTYDPATRTLSGTLADIAATTTYNVTGTQSDGIDTLPLNFAWTVVHVPNRAPICTAAMLGGGDLWPPNHTLVAFRVGGVSDPDGDALTITIDGISQNEPTNSTGDGSTAIDGVIDGSTAWLRAERAGTRTSRIYRVAFTASDGIAACSGVAYSAVVPHDRGKTPVPPTSQWWDSTVASPALPAISSRKK